MQRASEKIIAKEIIPFLRYNINKKGVIKMNILQQSGFGDCPLCKHKPDLCQDDVFG